MNENFEEWCVGVVPSEPHLLAGGRPVTLRARPLDVALTAEQAVKVARRILACAGVPPDAILLPPEPDAVIGGPVP